MAQAASALAWVIAIQGGPKRLFLQVGTGSLDADVATVNSVELTIPANQLGSGTPLPMTTNSPQAMSLWDGSSMCSPAAGQVYIGGYYRRTNTNQTASATLQVTAPTSLSNGSEVIPFTAIRWTSSGLRGGVDIPSGTFTGGTQVLRTISADTYVENCFTFSYANAAVRAAGTYSGQVTYTLTAL